MISFKILIIHLFISYNYFKKLSYPKLYKLILYINFRQKMTEKPQAMKPRERTDEEDTAIEYTFKPVKKKPTRKYRKGSKYQPILDAFLKSPEKLVSVEIEGKDANYIRTQLNKRISTDNKFKDIKVSVTNNVAYLEKP